MKAPTAPPPGSVPSCGEAGVLGGVCAAVASAQRKAADMISAEMGKVMAVLRAKHAATMDLGKAGPLVKAALGG